MKKWLMALAVVAISVSAFASEGWMTDFERAKEKAKTENKYILLDFSGSDWCPLCFKLEKEVFSQEAFKEYARENLVLVQIDFPDDKSKQSRKQRRKNKRLAEEFGIPGFPTVFILSPEAKSIAMTGYQPGGAEAYVEQIKKIIAEAK